MHYNTIKIKFLKKDILLAFFPNCYHLSYNVKWQNSDQANHRRGGTWAQLAVECPWSQKSTLIWFRTKECLGRGQTCGINAKSLSISWY